MILCIALVVSAFASWWLAQHLSAPIRRIQEGARALASENLDACAVQLRVSAGLEDRKDELAVLARDFDAMADRLRANRAAVTRLLRDISHELRSPLARMRLARRPGAPADGRLRRQLDRLEREIERLDELISQVLKLARLNGTDAPFEREAFDVDEIIEEVVHDAELRRRRQGLQGLGRRAARGRTVNGNRELLRSAIENVLRNAVRYSPPGRAGRGRRGARRRRTRDLDSRPGARRAGGDLERIFEPFYRVAESRDRDTGGEGIGLAITSQVMKAHGGSATAGNRAGGGFEVRLGLAAGRARRRSDGRRDVVSLYQEACKYIPGGVNSPVRAFRGVGGEPIFFKQAAGAHAVAADGRRFIDYVGSWGPMILGHAHPHVIAAVQPRGRRRPELRRPHRARDATRPPRHRAHALRSSWCASSAPAPRRP